jgi:hypothetical protein
MTATAECALKRLGLDKLDGGGEARERSAT